MQKITFEIIETLILHIRALALSGQTDAVLYEGRSKKYMHDIDKDIHWKTAGQYLIVYIESYGSDNSYGYRLYRCAGDAVYDRRIITDPAFESDECTRIFNIEECGDEITCLHLYNTEIWYEDYKNTISGLLGEEEIDKAEPKCNTFSRIF